MHYVTSVEYVSGYKLRVGFEDGVVRVVDLVAAAVYDRRRFAQIGAQSAATIIQSYQSNVLTATVFAIMHTQVTYAAEMITFLIIVVVLSLI